LLAGLLIILAVSIAYGNSFTGAFVLDDNTSIGENPSIRRLWPLTLPLNPPSGEGLTVEGRPVLNFSLALNYAVSGLRPWSYHAVNLLIHLSAALALFGTVRRTLQGGGAMRPMSPPIDPTAFACAAALLWSLHPVQTESVTYVVQRAESLMGLFYLLTLYCFIRYAESGPSCVPPGGTSEGSEAGRKRWGFLSIGACLLGMATKEVMVSAPVIVLLYDRTFLSGGFRAALRARRRYYGSLAATWILLAVLVVRAGGRGGTSGPGSGVGVLAYWASQSRVFLEYLRMAVWPRPLVFDYGMQWIRLSWAAIPALAVVAILAGTTCVALVKRPVAGFLGFWFFAILAPTSLVPGNRQTMAEHRMYLALVPLAVVVVWGVSRVAGRFRHGVIAAAVVALAVAAHGRNCDYDSPLALYSDLVGKVPANPYAQSNLGVALFHAGRTGEAIGHYREAIRLGPGLADPRINLGDALLHSGQLTEAIEVLEAAVQLKPGSVDARNNLGTALFLSGSPSEAADQFRTAIALFPRGAESYNNLGNALAQLGRLDEAIGSYRTALGLDPAYPEAHFNLGRALARKGRPEEAATELRRALLLRPGFLQARTALSGLGL
jgi:Flp pilus assembly protein TadD